MKATVTSTVVGLAAGALLLSACGSGSGTGTSSNGSSSKSSSYTVALSNSYAGNQWRAEMVANFDQEANAAVKNGDIKSFTVVNANNSASQQISQIQDMILKGYNAIVIDAASTTALNGVIAKACSAGIKVVVFDSLATAPCAYKVAVDYVAYGTTQIQYVAKRLSGKGNILNIRGIAGTSVDTDAQKGVEQIAAQYPNLHVLGNVFGNWTESVTQSKIASIASTLPPIDAIVSQGGESYGAAQALVSSGRKLPLVLFGNRGVALHYWLNKLGPNYQTISESSIPGMSGAALWDAVLILEGQKVPKTIYVPLLQITNSTLKAWVDATPVSGVATLALSKSFTEQLITESKSGSVPPVVTLLPNGQLAS